MSDIRAVAADYQRSTFGVRTIPAAAHPRELRAPHRFDVVSAISLLTHVPPHTFGEWLRAFFTLLQPGGAFLFTTHDLRLGPHRNDADGCVFVPYDEQRFSTPDGYGNTYVTREFVEHEVSLAGGRVLACLPAGLTQYQDVYVATIDLTRPRTAFRLRQRPEIVTDICHRTAEGTLEVYGWAASDGAPVAKVCLYGDIDCLGSARLGYERPDLVTVLDSDEARRCGWVFRSSKIVTNPTILTAVAESAEGDLATQCADFASGGHGAATNHG